MPVMPFPLHSRPVAAVSMITAGAIAVLSGMGATSAQAETASGRAETASGRAAGPIDFNRDVRPILSDNCFACHGPDSAKIKGGLRLDRRADALQGGESDGPAVVPGQPEASALLHRVRTTEADDVMPPKESAKPRLTDAQVATLRQWITEGAGYSEHWAFTSPVTPTVPVKQTPSGQTASPIDAFILSRLEAEGLTPSPEADRATLIRRASLDLTGLPPTAAEVASFQQDTSPEAWETVVNRLLASPHYGEKMAIPWLDMARFADSNGYQTDGSRYMWPWRDWVIQAFNQNMPFDRFTIEQLAGDLLPNPTRDQLVASGFNRNHRLNGEGGLIQAEWFVETVIDRVETTGSTWMGLTFNCCRCHDHKYDPVTQKEFYSFYSYFNSVDESGILDGDGRNTAPVISLPTPEQENRLPGMTAAIEQARHALATTEAEMAASQASWEAATLESIGHSPVWTTSPPVAMTTAHGSVLTLEPDGSVFAGSGPQPETDTYTLSFKSLPAPLTAVRLELMPDDRLPSRGPGRHANGNPIVSEITLETTATATTPARAIRLIRAAATFDQPEWESAKAIDGNPATGWAIHPHVGQPQSAVFTLAEPLTGPETTEIRLTLGQHYGSGATLGKFRVALTSSPTAAATVPPPVADALAAPASTRTPDQTAAITAWRREQSPELTAVTQALAQATKTKTDFENSFPTTMVMKELPEPRTAHVLQRGEYDKPGDAVARTLPAFLPALPPDQPNNRLGLARWMVSGHHPLTARVWVNRAWEKFFGTGLCKTSENLGSQAEWPSHPELLDWMATEFVRLGWDMKAMQKLIVMSAAYRQSARTTPELLAQDPENRLLARGPRFRLSAEIIRDQALAVSGLLRPQLGGPSVRPYMPEGVWDETSRYGDLRGYKHEAGDGLFRRTLYTIWKRSAGPPSVALFDGPNRDVCTVKRGRTNTPTQALALLNEITFVEAARVFATRILQEGGASPESRFTWAMQQSLARTPTATELNILVAGLARRQAEFDAAPDKAATLIAYGETDAASTHPPAELAAWTMMANVLMNMDEFVTRE